MHVALVSLTFSPGFAIAFNYLPYIIHLLSFDIVLFIFKCYSTLTSILYAFSGMGKEVENLIMENNDLLATK